MSDLVQFCSRNGVPLKTENYNIAAAEDAAAREILCKIQPTFDAEFERLHVIQYLKRLLKASLGVEVFPYGSVPLRTYIPDGDIDMTVFSFPNMESALFSDVYAVLSREEHNRASFYKVKDVQRIDAEVKIVKCIVQNFVVDISFNQLGGVQKLCFLEQVDRTIGKDHLFKRSVILLKSWCYYESRILGANHSLISTYALETLALHILQLFHSSFDGPIAVLHKFLDYYSSFDWDKYCISFSGPVSISSLPDMAADLPDCGKDGLLLNKEFLQNCANILNVSLKGPQINSCKFPLKHLNIIDPLKVNNNLGRSVSRGNFFRIRSAFKHGAQKLGQILALPKERVEEELKRFFANTLSRNDIIFAKEDTSAVIHCARGSIGQLLSSHKKNCSEDTSHAGTRTAKGKEKVCKSKMATGILPTPETVTSFSVAKSECPPIRKVASACCVTGAYKEHEMKGNISNKVIYQERPMGFSSEYDVNHATPSNQHPFTSGVILAATPKLFSQLTEDMSELSISTKTSKLLLDLSGDYNSHFESLLYGQFCQGYAPQPSLPASVLSPQLYAYNLSSSYPHMKNSYLKGQVHSVSHPTSEEKERHSKKGVHLQTKPLSGRNKNRGIWTKGPSQCQTVSDGLTSAPQYSRATDKSGGEENNFYQVWDGKINSEVKNSSILSPMEFNGGSQVCHVSERGNAETRGVVACGIPHLDLSKQSVPAIASTPSF